MIEEFFKAYQYTIAAISAAGTVGAVVVSLSLAWRANRADRTRLKAHAYIDLIFDGQTASSSLLKKLARAKGVVIHFPGVILREGEDARTVPGSGRPFLVHPAGGADSGGSSAARDTQARSRGLEGAEP